jgi:hypothetical protein
MKSAVADAKERLSGYDFFSLLTVTEWFYGYLTGKKGAPKPFLSRNGYIDLAYALIGVRPKLDDRTGKTVWSLDQPRTDQRLRAAGIDPTTWKIIDPNSILRLPTLRCQPCLSSEGRPTCRCCFWGATTCRFLYTISEWLADR